MAESQKSIESLQAGGFLIVRYAGNIVKTARNKMTEQKRQEDCPFHMSA